MIDFENTSQDKQTYRLFAQNIITAKAQQIFKQDKALFCLAKSDTFFKELLDIFNKLFYCNILAEDFLKVVESVSISAIDKHRLLLCAEVYNVYLKLMTENEFKIPYPKSKSKPCFINRNNFDIEKRLKTLETNFVNFSSNQEKLEQTNSIEYLDFSDIQSESFYVISQIKKAVNNGALYSDFAIFADKSEARRKILDMLKVENIPVKSSIYNENYENLKHKIDIYQKISERCQKLKIKEFSSQGFKEISEKSLEFGISKSQKEILLEELDEITKQLFAKTFLNSYTLDKIITKKENSKKTLIETVFSVWSTISDEDKEQITQEINSLKTFYEHYSQTDYAKAIDSIIKKQLSLFENTDLKDVVIGKIKSINELQNLYNNILKENPKFSAFQDILEWLPKEKREDTNFVKLNSISSDFKLDKPIKNIFILGLTENNFPATNSSYPFISLETNKICSKELKKLNKDFNYIVKTDEIDFLQKLFDFCNVISCCSEKIVFSTHSYEQKKTVLPSIFFKTLVKNDKKNYKKISDEEISELQKNEIPDVKFTDPLTNLRVNNKEKSIVIKKDDILKLNPSSINTFQQCPKKYYFKSLLNLKEPSNFAASYGSIVHAIFEVMNKNFLKSYNKETALSLADILFNSNIDEKYAKKALDVGFSKIDVELIEATAQLSLTEMKENFQNAMDDYELMGYFSHIPNKADCEKSFSFSIDELPNIVFDGRIDAILDFYNGELVIIDYKTGKDKTNSLSYAISDYGVNFLSKTGKEPANVETLQNNFDYQIPIYYLASQHSKELSEYRDKITELGLLYVRPSTKHDGCKHDFISAEQLTLHKDKIIENLKTTVIDKIVNETEFKGKKDWNCDFCSYKFLCDEVICDE